MNAWYVCSTSWVGTLQQIFLLKKQVKTGSKNKAYNKYFQQYLICYTWLRWSMKKVSFWIKKITNLQNRQNKCSTQNCHRNQISPFQLCYITLSFEKADYSVSIPYPLYQVQWYNGLSCQYRGLRCLYFDGFWLLCHYRGLRCLCLCWFLAAVSVQKAEMSVYLMVSGCRVNIEGLDVCVFDGFWLLCQ